jgi:undecaprenyl-diphosphatase
VTALDHHLQRWVVEHRVGALDPLLVALSRLGSFGLVWVFAAALAALAARRRDVLLLTIAAVAAADLAALALKVIVDRPRPYLQDPTQHPIVRPLLDYSLPSGHAATSFAAATVLARFRPDLAVPLYVLAAAIAWSRVYVGVHYPSDVLVGALLGLVIGWALSELAPRLRVPRPPGGARRRSLRSQPRD